MNKKYELDSGTKTIVFPRGVSFTGSNFFIKESGYNMVIMVNGGYPVTFNYKDQNKLRTDMQKIVKQYSFKPFKY